MTIDVAPPPIRKQAEPDSGRRFGLPTASALVVGSVIGTGVFALPSALAAFGPISLVAFGLVTIGSLALALTFKALLFIATVGLLFLKSANFGSFNASGGSSLSAISASAAIALFSYLGVETASVAAGRVRDPERNVGRATVLGTVACAFVYILATVAVFGTVAHAQLVGSSAPFTDSADAIFGGVWAGKTVAVAAIVSGIGALIGWTLVVSEMPQAAARDNLFPKPFAMESRAGVPAFGIVVSTALASLLTVVSYTSFDSVFTTIVLLSVLTSVIPYLFSAAAQLAWLTTRRRRVDPRRFVRDLTIAGVALVFSFWTLAGSGYQAVYYGTFCVFLGVPVYVWMRRTRSIDQLPALVPATAVVR